MFVRVFLQFVFMYVRRVWWCACYVACYANVTYLCVLCLGAVHMCSNCAFVYVFFCAFVCVLCMCVVCVVCTCVVCMCVVYMCCAVCVVYYTLCSACSVWCRLRN